MGDDRSHGSLGSGHGISESGGEGEDHRDPGFPGTVGVSSRLTERRDGRPNEAPDSAGYIGPLVLTRWLTRMFVVTKL